MLVKSKFIIYSVLLAFAASFSNAWASRVLVPAPPQVSASAYILLDADTGKVIVEENADKRLPPASLTKMMTSYIVSEEIAAARLKETDLVKVSDDAWRRGGAASGGSTMFLEARSEVSVIELMRGVIIQSGNDASIALAQHIAGGEDAFSDVMNQQALLLGMKGSHFENSTGLPSENHYTTARDMSLLARAVIKDHPEHYQLYSEKYYKYNGVNQPNRNKLLFSDAHVDGLKTGHTEEAGYCLVASAKRDGMRLISVVMGTKSVSARATASQKLLSYGFRYYQTVTLYKDGDSVSKHKVWKGETQQLDVGVNRDVIVTIPRGSHKDIAAEMHINSVIEAPINKGQVLGSLVISLDEEKLASIDLHALQEVKQSGFFSRMWDSILLMFHSDEAENQGSGGNNSGE